MNVGEALCKLGALGSSPWIARSAFSRPQTARNSFRRCAHREYDGLMTQKSFEESFQRARMAALGYEAAKKEAEALEAAMTEIEKVMKEFPRGPMGLPLESVRVTPEYRAAKNESTRRWERLRAFNEIFVKVFEKEIKKERAEITRARQSRR